MRHHAYRCTCLGYDDPLCTYCKSRQEVADFGGGYSKTELGRAADDRAEKEMGPR